MWDKAMDSIHIRNHHSLINNYKWAVSTSSTNSNIKDPVVSEELDAKDHQQASSTAVGTPEVDVLTIQEEVN